MDQDDYYQERFEVESLQQRLHKARFLEDDIEKPLYQYQPSILQKKQKLVSLSDTEANSNRNDNIKFKVLYKRNTPLNLKSEKKSRSQCQSETKSQIVKIKKRIAKKIKRKTK